MAVKPLYILYQAKNNTTGLTDVKAQIYFNGTAKLVGASALLLTELDSTNSPGLYQLMVSAAQLTTMGVATGQVNTVEGYIDSVTKPAKAPFREEVEVTDTDDLGVLVGTPAGASVSADIAAVKTDTAAIKVDLETGTNSLANILAAINSIKNGAGFAVPVPAEMIIPSSGSNAYLIPVTFYNAANTLIDPDTNTVTVGLINQAGTSRTSYLSSTTMTRASTGQYTVTTTIPNTAPEEQLIFSFSYSINSAATVRKATTDVITDINAAGLALQSTLLATQTTVNAINTLTTDATNGLAAIKTAVTTVGSAVTSLQTDVTNNIEGSGFTNATDSLHQISLAIANIGVGGRAV
jgi:hypothetical protein